MLVTVTEELHSQTLSLAAECDEREKHGAVTGEKGQR